MQKNEKEQASNRREIGKRTKQFLMIYKMESEKEGFLHKKIRWEKEKRWYDNS